MNNAWFFQDLLATIADRGRTLLPASLFKGDTELGLQQLVEALMSGRGEASGVAIARQLLRHYEILEDDQQRSAFFRYLTARLKTDETAAVAAATAYAGNPSLETLAELQTAIASPQQEFMRRLNLAPNGTAAIVRMRADLLRIGVDTPELRQLDADMVHLLQSWFNRGFLVLRRIDWQTSAAILDRIIAYEAVHEIDGWEDLKRRLDPVDRRCFGFFHPSLVDEPLIFVEVALMHDMPASIGDVLNEAPKSDADHQQPPADPTTAVFYSISNCQEGLRGISFGNFLIKQVVADLMQDHASLKTFVTLSPVPRFARWLAGAQLPPEATAVRDQLAADPADADPAAVAALAARYFLTARTPTGAVIDPVARFHLGNGARLERINVAADPSAKAQSQSHGVMVNYLYEPREIERNHEQFANQGTVAASKSVRALLRDQHAADPTPALGAADAAAMERA